jgi:hypothetical protein
MRGELLQSSGEFLFVVSEFLNGVAGGGEDGQPIVGGHGAEEFQSRLTRQGEIGVGDVEIVEIEGHETTGELDGINGSGGGDWDWCGIPGLRGDAGRRSVHGEAGNELAFAVVEEEKIVFLEIADGFAVGVADDDADDDEIDVKFEGGGGAFGGDFF